ncbi:MAG: flagellar hook-length control protein FliK [Paracoccaceae bacterium]|nr:flagellar hook-length control protein FliK [Paracoccaceae bacterium]
MSLAPLPINSSRSLPLPSEGLTAARTSGDPAQGSAHLILADLPDFAEMMTHIGKGVSAPMDLEGKECCSGPDLQAIAGKSTASKEDSPTDSTLSAAEEPLIAAAFSEMHGAATQDVPSADSSDPGLAVPQVAEVPVQPVKSAPWHPNLAENAVSEKHLNQSGRAEASRQMLDGDEASIDPLAVATVQGGATKVRDRVISLQEFTFVDGAARNGLPSTPHDDATPASYPVTAAARNEVDTFPRDDRNASPRPKTETDSPQKIQLTAVADPTGTEEPSSRSLSRRDSAVGQQEVALSLQKGSSTLLQPSETGERTMVRLDSAALASPKAASSWQGAVSTVVGSQGAETQATASNRGRPQTAPGPVTSMVPVQPIPPVAIDDLARDAGRAEIQVPPQKSERPEMQRHKPTVPIVASAPRIQDMAPFGAVLAGYPLVTGAAAVDGHKTEETPEGLLTAAISPAGAAPRPDVAMPRIDLPRHVAQQVADVATRAADGPVDLHLNPEELGKVRISMAMADGGITVTIQAERPDTLDLMRRHIDQLAQEFRHLGYGLISFSFGQQNQGQDNQSNGGPNQAASAAPEDQPGTILLDGGQGQKNGLDMRI